MRRIGTVEPEEGALRFRECRAYTCVCARRVCTCVSVCVRDTPVNDRGIAPEDFRYVSIYYVNILSLSLAERQMEHTE